MIGKTIPQREKINGRFIKLHSKPLPEKVASGEVNIQYVCSEKQVADGLTKPLSKEKFRAFREAVWLE